MRTLALLVGIATLLPTTVLAQAVTLPGTQPNGLSQPLESSAQCTECHGGLSTSAGRSYGPADTWPTSLMANAVRDPLFVAAMNLAENDHAGLGQYCLRCHTPAAFLNDHQPNSLDSFTDLDGVHCDTCHRSIDAHAVDANAPYIGDARLFFDDAPPPMQITRHGPYADPYASTHHLSVGDPFLRDARFCGQCHDVDNPLVHRLSADGTDTGQLFPLQTTYTEWLQSDFSHGTSGKTCQDCHMTAETGMLAVARTPGAPLRMNPMRHEFWGGNEFAMALLKSAFPGDMDDQFDAARMSEQTFLQTAATLEFIGAPAQVQASSSTIIDVKVTNLSGHKLPTGFEDARLMWIELSVNGTVVSGAFANDALIEDTQLRAYRFVPGHFVNGHATEEDHIAQHNTVIEDTRIPPRGMVANATTMPVGRDYSGGAGGALRNDDTAHFMINAPSSGTSVIVSARLMYQFTTSRYVDSVATGTGTAGSDLRTAWTNSGRGAPFAMASVQTTIPLVGGMPGTDGGADGSQDAGGSHTDASVSDPSGENATGGSTSGCHCRAGFPEKNSTNRSLVGAAAAAAVMVGARRSRRRARS